MREPGIEDATRRTRLANERTYLAWWRSWNSYAFFTRTLPTRAAAASQASIASSSAS